MFVDIRKYPKHLKFC